MKSYYQTFLTKKFKPKTPTELEKVKELERLFCEYVLIRLLKEISDEELEKLKTRQFFDPAQLAQCLKDKIPGFDEKFKQYKKEFLKKYVRNN